MKKTFIEALLVLGVFIVVGGASFLQALPKSLLLDRLLSKRDIHILADRVKEGPLWIEMENLRLFLQSMEVITLDRLKLYLGIGGIGFSAGCGKGKTEGNLSYLGMLEVTFKEFSCVKFIGKIEGKLLVGDVIRGNLSLEKVKFENIEVESARFRFLGKNFEGNIQAMGMNLLGGGSIKLVRGNPLASEIEASFKGALGNLIVRGKLQKPSVQFRR